jgi:lysophospholipase L1-like esterase
MAAEAAFGLVVSVGANDAVDSGDGRPRVAPSRTVDALAGMLDAASALGLPAFVVGPPPLGEPAADARILALTDRFAELCGARRIPFVPVAELLLAHGPWRAEAAAGDGAHPGAEGYQALAEIVVAGGFLSWLAEQCLSVRPVDAQTRIHPA